MWLEEINMPENFAARMSMAWKVQTDVGRARQPILNPKQSSCGQLRLKSPNNNDAPCRCRLAATRTLQSQKNLQKPKRTKSLNSQSIYMNPKGSHNIGTDPTTSAETKPWLRFQAPIQARLIFVSPVPEMFVNWIQVQAL